MIFMIGAVCFSALSAGLNGYAFFYVCMTYGLPVAVLTALGCLCAFYISQYLFHEIAKALGLTPEQEEAYELAKLLRKEFGVRTSLRKIEKDGMFTLIVRSAPVRLDQYLDAISKTLQRPVTVGGKDERGRLLLIVMPPGSLDDDSE
jgi:hypothetical protein